MAKLVELKKKAAGIRKKIVEMSYKSNASHIGGALSCTDILTVLYFDVMKINPKRPLEKTRDRLVLSKGHAAATLFSILAEKGFFEKKTLEEFHVENGRLWGHPNLGIVPGVEATTGSLGHGLPIGVGMALAGKLDGLNYNVFVVLSDGECEEGSNWEAALSAAHNKLDNLVAIIDYNKWQCFGKTNEVVNLEPLAEKWKAFGFSVKEVNGHNFEELVSTFKEVPFEKGKPSMIIANTVKGKGISFMEDCLEWHYKSPNKEQCRQAFEEIEKQAIPGSKSKEKEKNKIKGESK